eukprot:124065-Amphidinium_carterae.1
MPRFAKGKCRAAHPQRFFCICAQVAVIDTYKGSAKTTMRIKAALPHCVKSAIAVLSHSCI